MLLKRLKKLFKLLQNDLFQNERMGIALLRIVSGVIAMLAVALAVIFISAGVGWIITLLWEAPYINSRTSGSGQSVCDPYTNTGRAFIVLTGIAGYLLYGLFKFFRWLVRSWKESGKEE